jgi:hypothetical protein
LSVDKILTSFAIFVRSFLIILQRVTSGVRDGRGDRGGLRDDRGDGGDGGGECEGSVVVLTAMALFVEKEHQQLG